MKNIFIIISLISSVLLNAQSQIVNDEIEIIEEFHSINVNARYTVYLKQSNETKIEVKALKDILDISEFDVEDGVLNINIKREDKNKSIWEQIDDIKIAPTLDVFISMKEVETLNVNGNGKIITENSIASENLALGLYGNGSLEADIKGGFLNINHSGGGLMKLKGYADKAEVTLAGYGKIEAYELELNEANSKTTGSGNIELNISDELQAYVYGDGSIQFKGNTKQVVKKEYGSGKIERTY